MAGTNLIKRELTITVKDKTSVLDEKLYLFQNDRNIDLYFTIMNFKFDFLTASQSVENIVEKTNARYSTVKVLKPNNEKFISKEKSPIENDKVLFTITKEFIDEVQEIGVYKLQISLYDDQQGKITIPYIEFEVLEPIFQRQDIIEEYVTGQIDITRIGESLIGNEPSEAGILEINNRIASVMGVSGLIEWKYGDIISAERMNAINKNIDDIWDRLDTIGGTLDLDASNISYEVNGFKTVKDALDSLFYVPLSVSISINVDRTVEKGRVIKGCVISWTYNKTTITEQSLTVNNVSIGTLSTTLKSYSYTNNISSNTTFKITGKDDKNKIASSSVSITYYNRVYWGVSTSTTYNNNFILNELKNSTLSDSKNRDITVNAGDGQYIYYAIPSRLGNCTFFVGGFEGGFSKVSTISFTNSYNFTENYDIYKSTNANLGNTTITIK